MRWGKNFGNIARAITAPKLLSVNTSKLMQKMIPAAEEPLALIVFHFVLRAHQKNEVCSAPAFAPQNDQGSHPKNVFWDGFARELFPFPTHCRADFGARTEIATIDIVAFPQSVGKMLWRHFLDAALE